MKTMIHTMLRKISQKIKDLKYRYKMMVVICDVHGCGGSAFADAAGIS